jgi:MFS transporter, DHA2 family, multidrug resistance protein
MFAPLNVAALLHTPKHLRGAAVGMLALIRNEGASFGTSMVQTIQERRDQFHTTRVGEFLDPFNQNVSSFLEQTQTFFFRQTGDPVGSQQMALQVLADLRRRPAASFAYFDIFFVAVVASLGLVFLVFRMKRSGAEKSKRIWDGRLTGAQGNVAMATKQKYTATFFPSERTP